MIVKHFFFLSRFIIFQPVGFVTFQTRAGAEAAKQDLQVRFILVYTLFLL